MIWLLLFGALFKRAVDIPGFHGRSYVEHQLNPGHLARQTEQIYRSIVHAT